MIFLGKKVDNNTEPFIVAEVSGNHGGNYDKLVELIEQAKWAGADAVKIQCYDAEDLTIPNGYVIGGGTPWSDQTLYELYKEVCTPKHWMEPTFDVAKQIGIPIFSSVYSEAGLEVLERVNCPAYKIASYEANDIRLIKMVLDTGKPVVISTGTLNDSEMARLDRTIEGHNVILLHCVSKYPTELDELALCKMQDMHIDHMDKFPVGFSCHTDNPVAMSLAAVYGAAMIEVHLALDSPHLQPDFEFSFLPDQLKWAIDCAKKAYKADKYNIPQVEQAAREFKRSLHIVKDINKGEVFTEEHVKSFRPNTGSSPHLLPNIIGRKATKTLKAYQPMHMEYVE